MVDPAPLGAAILAGVGSEAYGGYGEAVDALVGVAKRFEPDATRHDAYRAKLARYRELYPLSPDD
jgi:sugar (pentulose or hexulose) kinase